MRRKQAISKADEKARKFISQTGRQAERERYSDRQVIREILDRRHEVSIILS